MTALRTPAPGVRRRAWRTLSPEEQATRLASLRARQQSQVRREARFLGDLG